MNMQPQSFHIYFHKLTSKQTEEIKVCNCFCTMKMKVLSPTNQSVILKATSLFLEDPSDLSLLTCSNKCIFAELWSDLTDAGDLPAVMTFSTYWLFNLFMYLPKYSLLLQHQQFSVAVHRIKDVLCAIILTGRKNTSNKSLKSLKLFLWCECKLSTIVDE